ncbi:MAG: phosphatidylserine decarboxylase [Gammaproteobacteria bacterium]|nr:phosphatidylserine decarboxylase [Gammaproteobacteria bacterium]
MTRWSFEPWKDLLIHAFIRRFRVDLAEAEYQAPSSFRSFNDFFTRALRQGARAISGGDALVSPVDGAISQMGDIRDGRIIQAKGIGYSLRDLVGDAVEAALFEDGRFATFYLAPHNYHRVHLPTAGRLAHMRFIPGRLFTVNPVATECVAGLFARNERIVCRFDTEGGPMIVCMVGAMFVGSMDTVWHGRVTPATPGALLEYDYRDHRDPIAFGKGAEIARFNMGSTVILLFAKGAVEWEPDLRPGSAVQMGERIGRLKVKSAK